MMKEAESKLNFLWTNRLAPRSVEIMEKDRRKISPSINYWAKNDATR